MYFCPDYIDLPFLAAFYRNSIDNLTNVWKCWKKGIFQARRKKNHACRLTVIKTRISKRKPVGARNSTGSPALLNSAN